MASELIPVFQDVTPSTKGLPLMSGWYYTSVVSGISEEALPWMLAQGWQLNAAQTDNTVDPPITTYLMAQTKMLHWNVLQDLLIDFTNSYNEGRDANDKRYEDVVDGWQDALDKAQADLQEFQDDKAQNATGYVTLMLAKITDLETDFDTFSADFTSYDSADRTNALAALKSQWEATATSAAAEYATTVSGLDLGTIIADVDTAMDQFTTAVNTFNTTYATLPTTLSSDFTTHQALTRGLLTDLGTTETARINEKWDNSLAAELQKLTDRGFYSSGQVTDITTRNTRERSEDLAKHNDALSREKLTNEHTLYNEQFKMRLGGLEASMKSVDASAKIVSSRLQHGDWTSKIRHQVAALSVASQLQLLSIRGDYYKTLLSSISWESDRRTQLYNLLTQTRLKQFELRSRTCDKDLQLLKYQLDERNGIAASLFGFVERRTDEYPDMGSIAQLTASLGETGAATWQSA